MALPRIRRLAVLAVLWAIAGAAGPPPPRKRPDVPQVGRVSLVPVHDTIDRGVAAFLRRVLAQHREGELVVLELNTLGGELEAAISIRDALLEAKATTLCWVRPRAISAGALITLACDVVAVAPGAMIGAATPVQLSPGGAMRPVHEKVVSYMRKEMATTAVQQGRPAAVAEAMVDADLGVPGLIEKGKLLTLDAKQALEWSVADLSASSEAELWQALGRDPPALERPRPSPAEQLSHFLSNPVMAVLLIVLGLLGIAVELIHPQGGTALLGGLFCLGLFFFGHHLVDLAGWEELLLLVAGLVLLAIELWTPGHTVFGVAGLHLVLASLFLALVSLDRIPLEVAWQTGAIPRALGSVLGALLLAAACAAALLKALPQTRFGRDLVLARVLTTPAREERGIALDALVGQVGVALTDLRPTGRVEVINRRADARLEYGFLHAGARVRVLRVEGQRVVVREEPTPPPGTGEAA